jgi:hypothetical protein
VGPRAVLDIEARGKLHFAFAFEKLNNILHEK